MLTTLMTPLPPVPDNADDDLHLWVPAAPVRHRLQFLASALRLSPAAVALSCNLTSPIIRRLVSGVRMPRRLPAAYARQIADVPIERLATRLAMRVPVGLLVRSVGELLRRGHRLDTIADLLGVTPTTLAATLTGPDRYQGSTSLRTLVTAMAACWDIGADLPGSESADVLNMLWGGEDDDEPAVDAPDGP